MEVEQKKYQYAKEEDVKEAIDSIEFMRNFAPGITDGEIFAELLAQNRESEKTINKLRDEQKALQERLYDLAYEKGGVWPDEIVGATNIELYDWLIKGKK